MHWLDFKVYATVAWLPFRFVSIVSGMTARVFVRVLGKSNIMNWIARPSADWICHPCRTATTTTRRNLWASHALSADMSVCVSCRWWLHTAIRLCGVDESTQTATATSDEKFLTCWACDHTLLQALKANRVVHMMRQGSAWFFYVAKIVLVSLSAGSIPAQGLLIIVSRCWCGE